VPSFSDNLDTTGTVTIVGDVIDTSVLGENVITYNAVDSEGNVAVEVIRTVTVVDTTAPVIALIGDADITLQAGSTYTELGATVSDNYDADDVALVGGDTVDTTTLGTYIITYDFTDSNSNTAVQVTRQVTVIDTTAPVITLTGDAEITLEVGSTYTELGATATDNYDATVEVVITGALDTSLVDTYTITYTATDSNSNTSNITRTVDIVDTVAPVIIVTGGTTFTIGYGETFTIPIVTLTDNYDDDRIITLSGVLSEDIDSLVINATYTITYNATDANNNAAEEVVITVTVVDTTAPEITLNGDAEITLEAGEAYTELGANVTDNVDSDDVADVGGDTVDTSVVGTYVVTYDFTDSSSNDAIQVTRIVTVVDTINPVLTLVGNASISVEAGTTYTDAGVLIADNATVVGNASVVSDVDTSVLGTYTVTYTYTDPSGNAAVSVSRTVVVEDNNAPVITLIGDDEITLERGASYTDAGATFSDNLDASGTITVGGDTVLTSTPGVYTITYDAVDSEGNNATQVTRQVTVEDTTAPTVTNVSNISNTSSFTITTDEDIDTYNLDNAGETLITATSSLTLSGLSDGTYNITLTDLYNNTSTSYTFIIDTEVPVITITGATTINLEYLEDFVEPVVTVTDNNDDDIILTGQGIVSSTIDSSDVGNSFTITYSATDAAGNDALDVVLTINIVDTIDPTFDDISDQTIETGTSDIDWTTLITNVQDNYNVLQDLLLIEDSDSIDYDVAGTYPVTVSVTDTSGNFTLDTFTVIVVDTTDPVLTLVGNETETIEAGTTYTDAGVLITDNATVVGNASVVSDVDTSVLGTYTVTYSYTDPSGNAAASVSRTVVVEDNTAPIITLNGNASITLTVGDTYTELGGGVTDNIYPNDVAVITGTVNTAVAGTYTLNYDYTDGSGNVATRVTRTVVVQDAPGTQSNPNQISTTQQFIDFFNYNRSLVNNFNKEYFILMNDLDFQNAQLPQLELLGHLDGNEYTISNVIVSSSSASSIGFFRTMNTGSLKDITFDNIEFNNQTTYSSSSIDAGLLFGKIESQSGTNSIDNVTISNSSFIYNTTTTGRIGLIAGYVKNAAISNITLSNNSVEYRSSYAAPEHWFQGFMFGHNGGTVTISSISGTGNKLFHNQGDASTNAPGVIIGYALAKSSFSSYLTLSNISLTVSIYLKTTGSRTWLFGHYGASNTPELVSSNVTLSTSVLNISSY
jgi:hypothetical protein